MIYCLDDIFLENWRTLWISANGVRPLILVQSGYHDGNRDSANVGAANDNSVSGSFELIRNLVYLRHTSSNDSS
jgi:hypothetical protein